MKHTLEADSIMLEFGNKRVLQDVYIKCETGQTIGLVGLNGSGKTCLMNVIYGELKTTNKSIRMDGKTIYENFQNPEMIRYLPQFNFVPNTLRVKNIFRDFELDFATFSTCFPDFEKYYRFKMKHLSGGERRIIEIYIILASKTKFCMLDEPFSQVMPVHVETLKQIITDEKKNKGIIITDHLYEDVVDVCDAIYVLLNGKTYLTNNKDDLKRLGYISM